jgi:hypothetical protein
MNAKQTLNPSRRPAVPANSKSKRGAESIPKPNIRDLTTSFNVVPFVLYTDPTWAMPSGFDNLTEGQQVAALLKHPENIVIGLGNLSLDQIAAFSRTFNCTAQQRILQIFALEAYENGVPTDVFEDLKEGYKHTPYGVCRGTSAENAIDLVGFLFTTYGRIVDVDPNSPRGYVFEAISDPSEYLQYLDSSFFTMLDPFENTSMFMHILKVTNLFDPTKLKKSDVEKALKAEEEKLDPKAPTSENSENNES